MADQLPRRRTVVSVSFSARNPDALLVAEALAKQGVPLGCGGKQILIWAAAHLSGATNVQAQSANDPGLSEEELDTLLDDF